MQVVRFWSIESILEKDQLKWVRMSASSFSTLRLTPSPVGRKLALKGKTESMGSELDSKRMIGSSQ